MTTPYRQRWFRSGDWRAVGLGQPDEAGADGEANGVAGGEAVGEADGAGSWASMPAARLERLNGATRADKRTGGSARSLALPHGRPLCVRRT